VLQIWGAIELGKAVTGELLFALYGMLWVAVRMIGWFAVLSGWMSIAVAFRLKTYKHPARQRLAHTPFGRRGAARSLMASSACE
jgi:hypothetical protein